MMTLGQQRAYFGSVWKWVARTMGLLKKKQKSKLHLGHVVFMSNKEIISSRLKRMLRLTRKGSRVLTGGNEGAIRKCVSTEKGNLSDKSPRMFMRGGGRRRQKGPVTAAQELRRGPRSRASFARRPNVPRVPRRGARGLGRPLIARERVFSGTRLSETVTGDLDVRGWEKDASLMCQKLSLQGRRGQ